MDSFMCHLGQGIGPSHLIRLYLKLRHVGRLFLMQLLVLQECCHIADISVWPLEAEYHP